MNIANLNLCKLLLPVLLLPAFATAQKLPNIQAAGLRAPAGIKIDGKAAEWNELQAYNHAIQASYTVANDDNKLYLIVRSDKKEVINKMIMGGVSLLINKSKKSPEGAAAITYPAYASENGDNNKVSNKSEKSEFNAAFGSLPIFTQENAPTINLNAIFYTKPGTEAGDRKMDSLINVSNNTLNNKAKFVRLSGLQAGVDTLISVYNKDGVKASSSLKSDKTYTIEMAIDLKLLGLSAGDKTPFNYGIRFNEVNIDFVPGVEFIRDADGAIKSLKITDMKQANSYISALSNTDCWGQYTLQ